MRIGLHRIASSSHRVFQSVAALFLFLTVGASAALAQPEQVSGEANLKLPDLSSVQFFGMDGHKLLLIGILFCIFGLGFGLVIYSRLKNLPVHRSMLDISELIYETCKTYLITQGKFLLLLWAFIAVIIVLYFGVLAPVPNKPVSTTLPMILLFSIIGIAGSYGVAWFGIRVNTFANSRTAFASLDGKPYPLYRIPLSAGMSIGMMLISVELLIWIFVMRIMMLVSSAFAYFLNAAIAKARYDGKNEMNYESPLTSLVWITSLVSIALTYLISYLMIPQIGDDSTQWWKLATIISCGTLAGAIIPELVKVFTSVESRHTNEVVISAQEGGASLGILSGFVAGNFSGYYLGLSMVILMGIGYYVSTFGLAEAASMLAPAVFAFGLVAFGFLGMGPVTIAVDSYGPVTDNAQSVYELSLIENVPTAEIKRDFNINVNFERAKHLLEANDGAGNTFKATAKPVLIGTAVVGATTMIFSIIMALTDGLTINVHKLSLLHAPFVLGLITGGAMIYWFTGASTQAVTTGAYRAVEFIKANIKLDGVEKASVADSKKVVEICTKYAQKGMFNIFLGVFFSTLAFAFVDPFFFVGYLISIAIFGLYQAIFMANAGAAWDNAKKIVEVEMKQKGTPLHDATVIGDTVGDPFKDTSSVALNPVIKFTTLFGLLAVELAVSVSSDTGQFGTNGPIISRVLAAIGYMLSMYFVWRSFHKMRIGAES